MATRNDVKKKTNEIRYATHKPMTDRAFLSSLIAGDTLVFLVFAVIGERSHDINASGLLEYLGHTIVTALPFAIGWFVAAPFFKLFTRAVATNPKQAVIRTSLAWICGLPIALIIRYLIERRLPLSFAIVAFLSNLIILLVWRWPFALTNNLREKR